MSASKKPVTREAVLQNLTEQQKQQLLLHFNTFYECAELGEHELNIVYLAWLWDNGYVYNDPDFGPWFNEEEAGISPADFEITFEAGEGGGGGVNLDVTRGYYELDRITELLVEGGM